MTHTVTFDCTTRSGVRYRLRLSRIVSKRGRSTWHAGFSVPLSDEIASALLTLVRALEEDLAEP